MIWKKPSAYIDRNWHAFADAKACVSACGEILISTTVKRKTMVSLPPTGKCNGCLEALLRPIDRTSSNG